MGRCVGRRNRRRRLRQYGHDDLTHLGPEFGVADAVEVGIGLIRVRAAGAVVDRVRQAIAVRVRALAVVALPVVVSVGLLWVLVAGQIAASRPAAPGPRLLRRGGWIVAAVGSIAFVVVADPSARIGTGAVTAEITGGAPEDGLPVILYTTDGTQVATAPTGSNGIARRG